jgi:hypothetical protein
MKKAILFFFIFPSILLGQTLKHDSLFLDGKLVGKIRIFKNSISKSSISNVNNSINLASGSGDGVRVGVSNYVVSIDEFLTNGENKRIEKYFSSISENVIRKSNGKEEIEYIIIERFEGKTNTQISGYYLKKAGQLKNARNNWRIVGGVIATSMVLAFPGSTPILLTSSCIGLVSAITSLDKDYQSNAMLKKAGEILMK